MVRSDRPRLRWAGLGNSISRTISRLACKLSHKARSFSLALSQFLLANSTLLMANQSSSAQYQETTRRPTDRIGPARRERKELSRSAGWRGMSGRRLEKDGLLPLQAETFNDSAMIP